MGEVTDFPTWIPDQVGKWIAAAIAVVIMARINLTITLVIFIPLFSIIILSRLAWGRLLGTYRQGRLALDAATGFLGEVLGAVQAVKVAGAERDVVDHLAGLNHARAQVEVRPVFYRGLLEALNNSVVNFGIGVMLLMAGAAISQGTFSVGDFALFVSYLWFTTQVPFGDRHLLRRLQNPGGLDRAPDGADPPGAARGAGGAATRSMTAARCRRCPSRSRRPPTGWRRSKCAT